MARRKLSLVETNTIEAGLSELGWSREHLADEMDRSAGTISKWLNRQTTVAGEDRELIQDLLDLGDLEVARFQLYVSAPTTTLRDCDLDAHQDLVSAVVSNIRAQGTRTFWPCEGIDSTNSFQVAAEAARTNLPKIEECDALLLILMCEASGSSSALIELGIALGLRKKVTVLHAQSVRIPFMLRGFGNLAGQVDYLPDVVLWEVPGNEDALAAVERHGRSLLAQ